MSKCESFVLGAFLGKAISLFFNQEYRLGIVIILAGVMHFFLKTRRDKINTYLRFVENRHDN